MARNTKGLEKKKKKNGWTSRKGTHTAKGTKKWGLRSINKGIPTSPPQETSLRPTEEYWARPSSPQPSFQF